MTDESSSFRFLRIFFSPTFYQMIIYRSQISKYYYDESIFIWLLFFHIMDSTSLFIGTSIISDSDANFFSSLTI